MSDTKTFKFAPPLKGVNTRFTHTRLAEGEYANLKNVELVENIGAFVVRKGTEKAHSSAMSGSYPVRGGIRWSYGATPTKETVFAHNDKLYKDPSSPTQVGSTTFTAGKEWYFGEDDAYLYAVNGTENPQRWDGTTLRQAGFASPSSPTVADNGAGVLNGAYKWKVTFIYDSVTARESSASSEVSGTFSSRQVRVTIPTGAAGSGVTGRRIYRTKAGGTQYFLLTTIANNTATTYDDNTADASLGVEQAPTDNGRPPVADFIVFYRGRMVLAKGKRIYLSAIDSTERNPAGTLTVHGKGPEIFPADHYIDIGGDSSSITGLAVWNDLVTIFKENRIFTFSGSTAADMDVRDTGSTVGCIAPRTIVNMGSDGLYFLGRANGSPTVFAFRGGRPQPISDAIEPTLRANVLVGSSYTVQPSGGRYRDTYLLSYTYTTSPSAAFEIAQYDPKTKRWGFHRGPAVSCWIPYTAPGDTGEMYTGHGVAGWIARWDHKGGDFDSTAPTNPLDMQMVIETGWLDIGAPDRLKQLKEVYVVAEAQSGATLTLERRYDLRGSGVNEGALTKTMTASISGSGIYVLPVDGVHEGGAVAIEQGHYCKFLITIDIAYTTESAHLPVVIHEVWATFEIMGRDSYAH